MSAFSSGLSLFHPIFGKDNYFGIVCVPIYNHLQAFFLQKQLEFLSVDRNRGNMVHITQHVMFKNAATMHFCYIK